MYTVILDRSKDEHYAEIIQWCKCVVGNIWEAWDFGHTEHEGFFGFKHAEHAKHFEAVWGRSALIFPYDVWKEFCQEDASRARLQGLWKTKGWVPSTVLCLGQLPPPKMSGGRSYYNISFGVWFFEFEVDALLFWMDHHG